MRSHFLLLSIFIVLTGCQHYENFGYVKVETDIKGGRVNTTLFGEKTDWVFKAQSKSPYDLIIRISSEAYKDYEVQLTLVEIKYSNSKQVIFSAANTPKLKFKENQYEPFEHRVYFTFDDIAFNYEDVDLKLKLTFSKGTEVIKEEVLVGMPRKYESFWQSLLTA